MNYTRQQKALREHREALEAQTEYYKLLRYARERRERREALLVSAIGWTALVIGAVLATLSVYTATVIILGYPH